MRWAFNGKVVNVCCHELFEVLCGMERMWQDTFTTNLKYYVEENRRNNAIMSKFEVLRVLEMM
jgi:hypothetical protein